METISVGGKEYVKAGVLARELGYTTDYVGQLCRGGKVEAELVGRSWYVEPASLRNHKQSRYRSTVKKSKTEIRKVLVGGETEKTPKPNPAVSARFYRQATAPTRYEEDKSDLIPVLKERPDGPVLKRLPVEPADAERLSIRSESADYAITTTDLPEITLSGKVEIADGDPDPTHLKVASKDRSRKVAVKTKKSKPAKQANATATPANQAFINRLRTQEAVPETAVAIPVRANIQPTSFLRKGVVIVQFVTALVLALAISIGLLGFERHTYVQAETVKSVYSFNLSSALEALKYPLK